MALFLVSREIKSTSCQLIHFIVGEAKLTVYITCRIKYNRNQEKLLLHFTPGRRFELHWTMDRNHVELYMPSQKPHRGHEPRRLIEVMTHVELQTPSQTPHRVQVINGMCYSLSLSLSLSRSLFFPSYSRPSPLWDAAAVLHLVRW